jgi:hypothetical protein
LLIKITSDKISKNKNIPNEIANVVFWIFIKNVDAKIRKNKIKDFIIIFNPIRFVNFCQSFI